MPIQIGDKLLDIVPVEVIRETVQHLVTSFKWDYERLFPVQIDDEATLLYLSHLSWALKRLAHVSGFAAHMAEFKNDVNSTYLVTTLAAYLIDRSSDLELEPTNVGLDKRPDIRIDLDGQSVFIECKDPKKDVLTQLRDEQKPMYEALKDRISRPCDVFITYEERLTTAQIERLGHFLESRLTQVTGEGTILDHEGVKVEVTNLRESFNDIGDVQVQLLLDNYHANERNPVTIFNRAGIAIGFTVANVSVLANVEQQFKAARGKVPRDAPLILAIHSDYLPGSLDRNIRAIAALFQPAKYTSINGVLLVRWRYTFQRPINLESQFINNPYARNPVADLAKLFRDIDG